jgi:uncharacterized membrane protein (UPF0127 family)
LLAGLLCAGCRDDDGSAKTSNSVSSNTAPKTQAVATADSKTIPLSASPTHAQPKLRTIKLWLGREELVTELALTHDQVETGMMFRTEMAENEGMLFVFSGPFRAAFWMRNTLLPLSCAYIDPDGVILELHDMQPKDETTITASTPRVQYVLEVKQGWFQRHNINVGAQVRTERGTLAETFFSRR